MSRKYIEWYTLKAKLERRYKTPHFSERDIWWCSLGANIGQEEDGKHELFERPVYILKRFSKDLFIGLPLTSVKHEGRFYCPVSINGKTSYAMLSQVRSLSAARLSRKIGRISKVGSCQISKRFKELTAPDDELTAKPL